MLPEHFRELCEGHNAIIKREYETHLSLLHGLRKQAFFSILPHAEKGFSFHRFSKDFWPLPGDDAVKDSGPLKMDAESYAAALAAMRKQVQIGRRKKQNIKANAGNRINSTGQSRRRDARTAKG